MHEAWLRAKSVDKSIAPEHAKLVACQELASRVGAYFKTLAPETYGLARPTCTQKRSSLVFTRPGGSCDEPASAYFTWPGRERMPICRQHLQLAEQMGEMMGIDIHTEVIPEAE